MKNVIAMLIMISCSVLAYAESVAKSVSEDVVDISCMPGSAVCDVTMANGQIMSEEQSFLPRYLPVAKEKGAGSDALFVYNTSNEIIGLNPKTFKDEAADQQQAVAQPQASEPPYKLESRGTYIGSVNIEVVSMVSKLTVQSITVNEGECPDLFTKKKLPQTIKIGSITGILVSQSCNIVKIDVVTDQGSWTHTFR